MRRGPFAKPISMNFSLPGPSKARQRTSRASWALIFNDIRRSALWKAVEQDFHFPARSIPIDQFDCLLHRAGRAIGQQTPFDRLNARWRIELARDQARRSDALAFARGQLHALHP